MKDKAMIIYNNLVFAFQNLGDAILFLPGWVKAIFVLACLIFMPLQFTLGLVAALFLLFLAGILSILVFPDRSNR